MKAMRVVVVALLAVAAVGCTQPTGAGGGRLEPSCPEIDRWAVGDSITKGYGGVAGWPDQTSVLPSGEFSNKGVGGQTIAWLSRQTGFDFARCAEQGAAMPDQVVFMAGTNDLANAQLSLAAMQGDIQELVGHFNGAGVDFRLVSIPPIPAGSDWTSSNGQRVAFNNWLASTYPGKYVNCSDNLQSGTWLNPAYALGDRAHLSDAGEQALAACIQNEA